MAGNEDDDTELWFRNGLVLLRGMVDETIGHLAKRSRADCDTAEADRRARAIYNVARAAQAIVTFVRNLKPATSTPVDGMRDEDEQDELCPEAVERVRDELRSRLEHLRSVVERKCLAAGLERPDPDGGFELYPETP